MSQHTLKIHPEPFEALLTGKKTCEVRNCLDRKFLVGQTVELKEFDELGHTATGRKMYRRISHIQTGYGLPEGMCVLSYQQATPSSEWRQQGREDHHSSRYDGERAELALGHLTDDQLANAAFLGYDLPLDVDRVLNDPSYHSPIALMTAVKDRIRWLSRALEKANSQSTEAASHE